MIVRWTSPPAIPVSMSTSSAAAIAARSDSSNLTLRTLAQLPADASSRIGCGRDAGAMRPLSVPRYDPAVAQRYGPTSALVVVDMQNDFADPKGSLFVNGAAAVL